MIHVCSLARLHETVEGTGARHVVSLIGNEVRIDRPSTVVEENHLWLRLHDISAPIDGYVMPDEDHVADLLKFVRRWDCRAPLVVHCYAGISRSTAERLRQRLCAQSASRRGEHRAGVAACLTDGYAEYPHRFARRPAARTRRPYGRRH